MLTVPVANTSPSDSPRSNVPDLPESPYNGAKVRVKNTFIDLKRLSTDSTGGLDVVRTMSAPIIPRKFPSILQDGVNAAETAAALNSTAFCNEEESDAVLEARPVENIPRPRYLTYACDKRQEEVIEKSPRSSAGSTGTPAATPSAPSTTVMLKNLPEEFTRGMLLDTVTAHGFGMVVDFIYLPIDFGNRTSFGYAFVNLVSPEDAERFLAYFQDFCYWPIESDKNAQVDWSGDRQGLEALLERYRNSPMMHNSVPDEAKPIVLSGGVRQAFPPPTRPLKPLRVRQSKARRARNLGLKEIKA